jgi:hypothetical protein
MLYGRVCSAQIRLVSFSDGLTRYLRTPYESFDTISATTLWLTVAGLFCSSTYISMACLLSEELWFLVFEQVLGPHKPFKSVPEPFALPGREPILPLLLVCRQWQVREVQ